MLQRLRQEIKEGKTLLQFSFLKGLGLGLGMIAPLVIAKYFEPALFGSYSLAKMIVFFFTTLLIASAQTPFVVFANRERAETGKINKTFSAQCVFLLSSTLIFSILIMVFRRQIAVFAKISSSDLFFMWLAYLGLVTKSFLCNLFLAMGQRLRNSLAELIFGVLTCLLVVGFVLTGGIGLKKVFLVYFVAGLSTVILAMKAVGFAQLRPLRFDIDHAKAMFDFTKWLMLGSTAVYFINWGDNLVLRIYQPIGNIGAYNLGYQVFKGIVTFAGVVYTYFLSFVSTHIHNKEKMRDYLYRKRPLVMILGSTFICFIFLAAPYLLKLIYKGSYNESITILRILLIGSVFVLWSALYAPILQALKLYKFTQPLGVFQVTLNLIIDFALVPRLGIIGAAVATVIAYISTALTLEIYFQINLKKRFRPDREV